MLRFSAICVVVGVVAGNSLAAVAPTVSTTSTVMAIITQDQAYMRAAPRDSAQQQAVLSHGEMVEVRGERMDYVQVYDHRRERGGYVRATQLKRIRFAPEAAAELLGVVRFLRDTIGAEALGIGYVAAYLKAASGAEINSEAGAEAFDALGLFAERLARRVSSGNALSRSAAAIATAHLDVATRYGVTFNSYEQEGQFGQGGRMQICYNGEAFARVLAISSHVERRANAALILTRYECTNPALRPVERVKLDEWRADVLSRVDATALPVYLKNRVQMRRAAVWSSIAYQQVRQGGAAQLAAQRAIGEFAGVNKRELTDDDIRVFNDTAMRVNASRWAAEPELVASTNTKKLLAVVTEAGQTGETCVLLVTNTTAARLKQALARRCTYGIVWTGSATVNHEGTALALAVQPMEGWRELWVFRKGTDGWSVGVLPPAATSPDIGYAEFAGWVPGGKQMLVAREARGEGKYKRSFELVRLNGFATERQASDPSILGVFRRWQDPAWVKHTMSMR